MENYKPREETNFFGCSETWAIEDLFNRKDEEMLEKQINSQSEKIMWAWSWNWSEQASREIEKAALLFHFRRLCVLEVISSVKKYSDQWACLKLVLLHLSNWNVHIKQMNSDLAGGNKKANPFWKIFFFPLATFKTVHLA